MKIFSLLFAILLSVTRSLPSIAQQVYPSASLWTSAGFELDLPKRFTFQYEQQVRIAEDFSEFDLWFQQISVEYKLHRSVTGSFDYRLGKSADLFEHRTSLNLSFSKKISKRLSFGYKIRHQSNFKRSELFSTEAPFDPSDHRLRNKLEARYNAKKGLRIFLASEIYFIHDYSDAQFEKYRLGAGLRLKKGAHIYKPAYIYQQEFNVRFPERNHIISISYTYLIDPKWKERKKGKG